MKSVPKYGKKYPDIDWGCDYFQVDGFSSIEKIKICHVKVNDIKKISEALARRVLDTSWMTTLDAGSQRGFEKTVKETASALVEIFEQTQDLSTIGSEFGEVMVSIGSTKALETIFNHQVLPIAELWKPKLKQNEGFDFHTVCKNELINFGEAKYSGSVNPHGDAIDQSKGFIDDEKHLRDYFYLKDLAPNSSVENLNNDNFGIVASFSINSSNPIHILENAVKTAELKLGSDCIKSVYLVGVSK
ncbi:hypothetical protein [Marinobacter alexandrii]|uniref:hypothetical protein n=1 Tax=Marinobacter alexandrii TaxID=2570351 RepID=UPI0011092207|nr:hypothetical protein [Marinobacter alexandrii]